MQSYKVLAALLSYPSEDLCAAVRSGEIAAVLDAEDVVKGRLVGKLQPLLDELANWDLLDLQERYVDLFDRSRSRSLYLFEHVHGESRDRGQAMVELKTMYEQAGLEIESAELPDYLPLYLEYLSALEPAEARKRLAQPIHVVSAVGERLRRRKESYGGVFTVLEALCPEKLDKAELDQLLAEGDDDPNDLGRIDNEWAEQPVHFGPDAPGTGGACARVKQMAERIAAAKQEMDQQRGREAGEGNG